MTPTQPPYKLHRWPVHLLLLAALGVAVFTLTDQSATRQYAWAWSPLVLLAWLAPVLAVGGRMFFHTTWHWPPFLLALALALLPAVSLLSAAVSPLAAHSLLRCWPVVGGVALFFWLNDWLEESPADHRFRTRRLARGLALAGAGLAVYSLARWIWHYDGIPWQARNEYPFGHSIYTAGALVLALPWIVLSSVKSSAPLRRGLWALLALIAFLVILTTSSRGGVIALGVVGLAAALLLLLRASWPRRTKLAALAVIFCILAVAVWSNPRLRELVVHRGWSASSQASNTQRSAMLEAGLLLGNQRPWLGWGPGTVPLVYPMVRHELSSGVDNVLQLHNTPVQLWATLGAPGILLLLLLLTAALRRAGQLIRQTSRPSVAVTAGASLIGYAIFALTDHQLDVPAHSILLVSTAALFFCGGAPKKPVPLLRSTKWYLGLATGSALAIPLVLTSRDLLARYTYDQSLTLYGQGRTELAQEYLESAANRAPYDPYYRHQLAWRLLEQLKTVSPAGQREQLHSEATVQLQRSLAAGCLQEYARFNLGWLDLGSGRANDALLHFLATLHEAPHRGGAYFGLGLSLRATGNDSAAVRAFALEWINDPASFAAPLWEWPDYAPLRPKVRAEADRLLGEIYAGNPQAAYVRDLWQWWESNGPPPRRGFDVESSVFLDQLAALANGRPVPPEAAAFPWSQLYAAWLQSPQNPQAFLGLANGDLEYAAALTRRSHRHPPPDWHGFLSAGLEEEPSFLMSVVFSRPGYGVVARHPDGPVLTNLYIQQQHRLVAQFTAGLFPPKGWLSSRILNEWLPAQAYRP